MAESTALDIPPALFPSEMTLGWYELDAMDMCGFGFRLLCPGWGVYGNGVGKTAEGVWASADLALETEDRTEGVCEMPVLDGALGRVTETGSYAVV